LNGQQVEAESAQKPSQKTSFKISFQAQRSEQILAAEKWEKEIENPGENGSWPTLVIDEFIDLIHLNSSYLLIKLK